MRDTNLVNALRKHAEWAEENQWETPITLGDDLTEAADRIEAQAKEIEKLRAQLPRWIPVEERLPEYNARVLVIDVYAGDGDEFIAIWTREEYPDDPDGCCWIDERGWWHALDEVTHWMPLPEPPEKALEAKKDE